MGIIAGIAVPTTIAVINRQKKNAAVKSAQNVFNVAKEVLMEASASEPADIMGAADAGVVKGGAGTSGDPYTYTISCKALVALGELEENPFKDTDAAGNMSVKLTTGTNKFTIESIVGTINGITVTADNIKTGNIS